MTLRVCMLVNLRQPRFHVLEGSFVGYIVHHDNSLRAAVVAARDAAEALLACGVPDLEFHGLAVQINDAGFKVDANCADVAVAVCVLRELGDQTRLADASVAYQQEFEYVVIRHGRARGCGVHWQASRVTDTAPVTDKSHITRVPGWVAPCLGAVGAPHIDMRALARCD